MSPYNLVYGKEYILPLNILLPSSQLAQASQGSGSEVLQDQINTLLKLEESRLKSKRDLNTSRRLLRGGLTNISLVRKYLK